MTLSKTHELFHLMIPDRWDAPLCCRGARRNMKAALHASLNPEYRAQILGGGLAMPGNGNGDQTIGKWEKP